MAPPWPGCEVTNVDTIRLPNSDLTISRVGLGGCPLGGHGWGRIDDAESQLAVERAYELGVTFFDTADVYGLGHSEELLRKSLGRRRHDVVIASKFGVRWNSSGKTWRDASPVYLRTALEASLRRLGLECISLYYVHWPDARTPIEDTMAELERCRRAGKIQSIGVSNFSAAQLQEACNAVPIVALQLQYSLVDCESATEVLGVALQHGVPFVTWGSLAQGLLTGKYDESARFDANDRRHRYENFCGDRFHNNLKIVDLLKQVSLRINRSPAQIAIRWILDSTNVGAVLFGAKRASQVEENVAALDWQLPECEYRLLEDRQLLAHYQAA